MSVDIKAWWLLVIGFLSFTVHAGQQTSDVEHAGDITATGDPPAKMPEQNWDRVHPQVLSLLSESERDAALYEIVSKTYKDKPILGPVDRVVVCPQTNGMPILAVFRKHPIARPESGCKGAFHLVDGDGTVIKSYQGLGVLRGDILDVTNDGIVDLILTCGVQVNRDSAEVLYVIPVTREQKPILRVAFNRRSDATHGRRTDLWGWRIHRTTTSEVYNIEIGPMDSKTGELTVAAAYAWSGTTQRFEGPSGGIEDLFMRMDTVSQEEKSKFYSSVPGFINLREKKPQRLYYVNVTNEPTPLFRGTVDRKNGTTNSVP